MNMEAPATESPLDWATRTLVPRSLTTVHATNPHLIPSWQSIYIARCVRTSTCRKTIWLFAKEQESKRRGRPHPFCGSRSLPFSSSTSVLVRIAFKKFVDVFFHFNGAAYIPAAKQREKCSGNWADAVRQGHPHQHGGWHMHGSLGNAWQGSKKPVTIRKLLQRFASSTRVSGCQHQVSAKCQRS